MVRFLNSFKLVDVKENSMLGTYNHGNILLIKRIKHLKSSIIRGDVIVCRFSTMKIKMIKRVIGLPLENLKIDRTGDVFINDKKLVEPYITVRSREFSTKSWQLKENEFFTLGDNRRDSIDSRRYGPISLSYIIGRVYRRIWPLFFAK